MCRRCHTAAGLPQSLSGALREKLRGKVQAQPDITLTELQDFLAAQEQTSVHPATISRALTELGLPRKERA